MKNKITNLVIKIALACLTLSVFTILSSHQTLANTSENDPVVVVSLGDSYSSGEGLGDYYGSQNSVGVKVLNESWIAHRSSLSWPALLEIPGIEGTLADYKDDRSNNICQWYFVASSGATTENFTVEQGGKTIYQTRTTPGLKNDSEVYELEGVVQPQSNIFDEIDGESVDYVTLTFGGNDVGFSDIMTKAMLGSTYLDYPSPSKYSNISGFSGTSDLAESLQSLRDNIIKYQANLKSCYQKIHEKAPNASIIVAGYPQLLDENGKGMAISKDEATMINENVSYFNEIIEDTVDMLADEMDIYFVSVEEAFEGHGAYSKDEWINGFILGYSDGDLNEKELYSSGSFHPNSKGAQAYANCVNEKIKEIESKKENTENTQSNYEWVVEPEIEADDMFLVRQTGETRNGAYYYNSCAQLENEYTVVKKGNTLDLIDQNGNLVTNWNLSSIREYGSYEIEFINPVDLTGNISTTYPQFDTKNVDRAFFFGNSSDYQYGNVEHADPGFTEFYYSVDDTLCCSYSSLSTSADIEPPHMVGVPQSETMYDASDTDFYSNIANKFAIFTGNVKQTDFIYDACGGEEDGIMAVSQNGKWGYIDQNGRTIIPIEYDASWGYCVADGVGNDKTTVNGSDTAFSSEFRYACYAPSDGYINLVKDGEWELRNLLGELVIAPGTFEQILPVYDGKCWVKQNGKWGLIQITNEDEESNSSGDSIDVEEQADNQDTLNREKFIISSVYDISALKDHETFYIKGTVDGSPNEDVYLNLDGNTQFDSACDMQYFSNYQEGEIPQAWFNNNYWDALTNPSNTALLGVYDISVTNNHIDTIYGIYWWD